MRRAVDLAARAAELDEVPVGAVIVLDGRIIAESHNRTVMDRDATAHAEMLAIRKAADLMRDWRLIGTTLYVSLEPCAMCAGAIILSRVPRVVYGASDPKAGMAGSLGNLLQDPRLNHRCRVTLGILAEESSEMLRAFFRARR